MKTRLPQNNVPAAPAATLLTPGDDASAVDAATRSLSTPNHATVVRVVIGEQTDQETDVYIWN
jgi:hypothetical protein